MPQAEVNTAYNRGTALLFVNWDLSSVNLSEEGTYQVSGVVQTIGANKDQWTGDGGSTSYLAENKVLYSSNEMKVTATVEVSEPAAEPVEKPAQVTGLKASSTVSAVTLSWKKVEDADSYIVYCKNAKGVYTSIGTTKKTSYTDKKKTAATAYSYKVCAVKENGEEQLSGSLSKEVKILTKPKAAAISSLKKQGSNGVLKFKQVAGVTSYEILRYDTKTKKYVPAYKVEGKKIYTYNSSKKKYVKSGTAKVSKKVITATLKKAAKGKYAIRTVVSKKGYGTVTGNTSKAAKLK
jgi:fibronectin type 3 domain-containing protein